MVKATFYILLLSGFISVAQVKYTLLLSMPDNQAMLKKVKLKNSYADKKEIDAELNKLISSLRNEGYLLAATDSIVFDSLLGKAFVTCGAQYRWANLKKGNADADMLAHTGFHEKFYTNSKFSPREVSKILDRCITWYENNGYPFARIKLDSVSVSENQVMASLKVSKGRFIKLDSIIIEGNARIKKGFLARYTRIKEGDAYDEHYIRQVPQRLRQLPFLRETKPQVVKITENQTKLYLFLDKKNASQFDGILGLQPQPNGKTVLTGDARIRLYNNIFRSGELFDLNWKRLQYQTQDFKTSLTYPYLFNTPIGTEYSLGIYKRDTTFIDVQNHVGLQYLFNGLNYFKVFYKQRNTNLLSTASLAGLTVLPDYADISTYAYGLGAFFEKLDYRFNPRKGISLTLTGSTGNREIKKNSKLNESVYTNVLLKSTQYQTEGSLAFYLPIMKFSTFKIGVQGGGIAGQQLFRNELFRIGGFKTIRGIDEQSIFASSFGVGTIEYRFLFEQNSALVLFADGAWYENNSLGKYVSDTPYSVGAGVSFETKAGIFQMNYALGSQFGNAFDLRTGKINFGLVNTF